MLKFRAGEKKNSRQWITKQRFISFAIRTGMRDERKSIVVQWRRFGMNPLWSCFYCSRSNKSLSHEMVAADMRSKKSSEQLNWRFITKSITLRQHSLHSSNTKPQLARNTGISFVCLDRLNEHPYPNYGGEQWTTNKQCSTNAQQQPKECPLFIRCAATLSFSLCEKWLINFALGCVPCSLFNSINIQFSHANLRN